MWENLFLTRDPKYFEISIFSSFFTYYKHHTLYIQVAYDIADESTKKREIKPLTKIPSGGLPLLLSMNQFEGRSIEGIPHQYLLDWLD